MPLLVYTGYFWILCSGTSLGSRASCHRCSFQPWWRDRSMETGGKMKEISRRQFGRFAAFATMLATVGWSAVLEGCASFATISGWVVTGLDSFQSVVDLLVGQGVIMVAVGSLFDLIIKAVKAAIGDIAAG